MKINKMGIALVTTGLLLTGCSQSSTVVEKDGKDVIASLTEKDIFADDLFTTMTDSSNSGSIYFEAVLQKLVDEKFPITKDMEIDADSRVESIELTYASNYGSEADVQLQLALEQSGFQDLDDYKQSLLSALQYSEFLQAYVDANFDTVLDDYYNLTKPRELQIVKISTVDVESPTAEEQAEIDEVKKLVESSKDFGELAAERSSDVSASNNGQIGIVDNTSGIGSTYGSEVETQAFLLNEGEVTSEPVKGTDGYYFIKCVSTNKDYIGDEIKGLGIDSPLISYDQYLVYLAFNSYQITYDDTSIETIMKTTIDEQLAARNELRGGTE